MIISDTGTQRLIDSANSSLLLDLLRNALSPCWLVFNSKFADPTLLLARHREACCTPHPSTRPSSLRTRHWLIAASPAADWLGGMSVQRLGRQRRWVAACQRRANGGAFTYAEKSPTIMCPSSPGSGRCNHVKLSVD